MLRLPRRHDPSANDRPLDAARAPMAYAIAQEYGSQAQVEFELYERPGAGNGAWVLHLKRPPRLVLGEGLVLYGSERELRWTLAHEVGHLVRPPRRLKRRALYALWRSQPAVVVLVYLLLYLKVIGFAAYASLLCLPVLLTILFPLLALWLTRREERLADAYANALTGYGPEPHYFGDSSLWLLAERRPWLRPLARALSTHPPTRERVAKGAATS